MANRRYHHYCPVARAMELLGGRWTVLILRELATGPKRYSDLMDRLERIGTNLLAQRIRELQDAGLIIRQTQPAPSGSRVYVLTALGEQTRPLLRVLAQFGAHFMDDEGLYRPSWLAETLLSRMTAGETLPDEMIECRVDDEVFYLDWRNGEPRITLGAAHRPALVIETDQAGLEALTQGRIASTLQWSGEAAAWTRFRAMANLHKKQAAA